MLDLAEYVKIFVGLLAIIEPFGIIPIFISMTADQTDAQRKKTVNMMSIAVLIILWVSLFVGEPLLQAFGISIDSFRVGGGILILLMAISMLNAKTSPVRQTLAEASETHHKESVAIVPLAMPLLAGPGAISSMILVTHKSSDVMHYVVLAIGILVMTLLIWALFRLSPIISGYLSQTSLNVVNRIMGLILAAIAVEFITNGMKGLFPVLAS